MTFTSKSYLAEFDAPSDSSYPTCTDSDDESDDSDVDLDEDIGDLRLADCQNNSDRPEHWSQCLDAALRSGL